VSRVAATGAVQYADRLAFRDLRLRFDPLRLDLARRWVPELPAGATLAGPLRLDGAIDGPLAVDGDLTIDDPATGRSRVAARGGLDLRGDPSFRGLSLRLDPLRLDLVRGWVPELPAGAAVSGPLRLDGSLRGELALEGDLTITDPATGVSRVAAAGGIDLSGEPTFRGLSLRLDPLRLDLLRGWVPDLPAGATATGPLRLDGSPGGWLAVNGDLRVEDPASGVSRVSGEGELAFADELRFRNLRVRTDPLQLDLLRRWAPDLPQGALVIGNARLDGAPARALQIDGEATIRDPATGESRVYAAGGIRTAGGLRFDRMQMRFEPLQTSLVRAAFPEIPGGGTLAGRLWLDGAPSGFLRMDADLTHRDARFGTSHVVAAGGVNLTDGPRFANLRLDLQPLNMELVRALVPGIPLGGSLAGRATLDGSPDARLDVRGELEHREGAELSRVAGHVAYVAGPDGWASADVRLSPLSLDVAGRFVPEAGLRGSVSGTLQASGNLSAVALNTDLQVAGGGAVSASGTLDLAGDVPAYDLAASFAAFDAAAITTRAPASTSLTGPLTARGRGFEPATMRLELDADLVDSRVATLEADRVRLRLAVADGLLSTDSSVFRVGDTEALADGSFGLVAGRDGVLTYRVATGALERFAPLARQAEEGVRTGRFPARRQPATLGGDPLAGRIFADGTLVGNVTRFDASGRAVGENVVAMGNRVDRGWVTYTLQGIGTEEAVVRAETELHGVQAQGMEFDRLAAEVDYTGGRFGSGRAVIAADADDATDLRMDARFTLALDRRELHLGDLAVRVDTVGWRTTRPAVVAWGGSGVEVQGLELASTVGGRIHVDGRLPLDGVADLEVAIVDLEIGHLVSLLQLDEDSGGRLTLDARVQGTAAAPVITGSGVLVDGRYEGRPLPETRATFTYVDRELTAQAELLDAGRLLARVDGQLPVDLALTGVEGSRLLSGPIALDLQADSLPLDAIPGFVDQVDDLAGRISGDLAIRGTFDAPVLTGGMRVDLETLRVVPLGVTFREIVGTLAFQGDALEIESLQARSGGPIEISGRIGLVTLLEPSFDLTVTAEDAVVIDTDRARMRVDGQVAIAGPFDAIEVTGEVQTRSGVIYIPELADFGGGRVVNLDDPTVFARVDTILRAERDALIRRSPFLERLRVDLAIEADRDVWLRSSEANVEVYTPAEVGPLHLRLNGETVPSRWKVPSTPTAASTSS
jgi:hypothetical protein